MEVYLYAGLVGSCINLGKCCYIKVWMLICSSIRPLSCRCTLENRNLLGHISLSGSLTLFCKLICPQQIIPSWQASFGQLLPILEDRASKAIFSSCVCIKGATGAYCVQTAFNSSCSLNEIGACTLTSLRVKYLKPLHILPSVCSLSVAILQGRCTISAKCVPSSWSSLHHRQI